MEDLTFENPTDKLPPQNIEAEEAILGGILLDPEAMTRVNDVLFPQAFYISAHKDIYGAMQTLHNQGKPTDLLCVTTYLSNHDLLARVGGRNKMASLVDRCVSTCNIDALAELVVNAYARRQLIKSGNEIVALGYKTDIELDEVKQLAEQKIYAVTQSSSKTAFTDALSVAMENYTKTMGIADGSIPPGIPTGFEQLDYITGGFQRSDLIIIAGRPAMGKTSFAINIGDAIASNLELPVAVFSLEMSKQQLTLKMQAVRSKISTGKFRAAKLAQDEWYKYAETTATVPYNMHINDESSISVGEMKSKCRQLTSSTGQLGLVIIDYLQLMSEPRFKSDNRVGELSYITRELKKMARELDCPVIALSQLSRGVESRNNKRPMLSDLRDSGSIEQDADLVAFLYRDEYYNEDTPDPGIAELIIAKHRNGAIGTVKLLFDKEFTEFKNISNGFE